MDDREKEETVMNGATDDGRSVEDRNAGIEGQPQRASPVFDAGASGVDETSEFRTAYVSMGRMPSLCDAVEALLKRPATLVYEIVEASSPRIAALLLAIAVACSLGYGLVMGSFTGGQQLWMVPLRFTIGSLLSALICLPSLYIFTSLSGGRQTLPHATGLLLAFLALQGILLVGFGPIAWVFAQSTSAPVFMACLHLAFWGIATGFGMRLLLMAFGFLNRRRMGILKMWGVLFVVVALQMSTALRPLIGEPQPGWVQGKKFFITHWLDCVAGRSDQR